MPQPTNDLLILNRFMWAVLSPNNPEKGLFAGLWGQYETLWGQRSASLMAYSGYQSCMVRGLTSVDTASLRT